MTSEMSREKVLESRHLLRACGEIFPNSIDFAWKTRKSILRFFCSFSFGVQVSLNIYNASMRAGCSMCEFQYHKFIFKGNSLHQLSTLLNVTWGWLGQVDTISMGYIDSLFQLAPLFF